MEAMVDALMIARAGPERIDDLQPLWEWLQERHVSLASGLRGLPARSAPDSWARRRRSYQTWLAEPDAFVLIAELASEPVGYALVRIVDGSHSFGPSDRVASVETLSVAPAVRGRGVGTALLEAVTDEVTRLGIAQLKLEVVAGNSQALRFYQRHGFAPVSHTLMRAASPADGSHDAVYDS